MESVENSSLSDLSDYQSENNVTTQAIANSNVSDVGASQAISSATKRRNLTMYERSMAQRKERERKMKELEETLMVDFTFTPSRIRSCNKQKDCGYSMVSSLGSSPGYVADTAASRARRHRSSIHNDPTSSRLSSGAATPDGRSLYSATSRRSACTVQTASPRLEALYRSGQDKLRARSVSDEDESQKLRQRMEEKDLNSPSVYTFRPQTKWNLVSERRKMAREEIERQADQARRSTPKIIKAEREREKKRLLDQESMNGCTFKPKMKWDLVQEKRMSKLKDLSTETKNSDKEQLTRYERDKLARDKRYEEKELTKCTFKPNLVSSFNTHRTATILDEDTDRIIPIVVSSPRYEIVRRDMVCDIQGPKSPEWKRKFRQIGQNVELEKVCIEQGQADGISFVRDNTLISLSNVAKIGDKESNVSNESKGKKVTKVIKNVNLKADDIIDNGIDNFHEIITPKLGELKVDKVISETITSNVDNGIGDDQETKSTNDVDVSKKRSKPKAKKWFDRLARNGNKNNSEDTEKKAHDAKESYNLATEGESNHQAEKELKEKNAALLIGREEASEEKEETGEATLQVECEAKTKAIAFAAVQVKRENELKVEKERRKAAELEAKGIK